MKKGTNCPPRTSTPRRWLLAVDAVDELRDDLNDDESDGPPQLRTELLKLHQLAMREPRHGILPIDRRAAGKP